MAKFKIHRFVKESGTLISGNVWAQGISLLAYLLLTRLFSPEDFALFNIFYSYIEVLIIFSTCKYEVAVVAAENDREATAVARFALRLNLAVAIAVAAVVTVLSLGRSVFHPQLPTMLLLLIPPMVYFCGTSRIYSFLFNRCKQFNQIALSEVVNSTVGTLLKVLFGLLAPLRQVLYTIGLPLGTVLGQMAGNINYVARLPRLNLPRDITREERRAAARKHRNFALFTAPKDFINSFSYNLPLIWIAMYFDKAEVGLFALALTFTFRPINVLNVAFERVLYVRTAEKVRSHQPIGRDIYRFVGWLNVVALPLFVVAFVFAEPLFTFFFSGRWAGCGYYVRCLLPWVYIMLTSTSLMFVANIFSTQRKEFFFYIALLALRVVAMVVGLVQHNFQLAILLFAASGAVVSLSLLVWYLWQVRQHDAHCLAS